MNGAGKGEGEVSDAELVRRCQAGSAEAFDDLVRRHQEKIFNSTYRFCGDRETAADLTQHAFLNAYRKIRDFQGDAAFSTWIYRIAFNLCMSHRRDAGRHRLASLTSGSEGRMVEPSYEENAGERMEKDDTQRAVQEALGRLAEEEREIIILKDLEDRSYEEIGAILEIAPGTVRSRLHRARQSLRDQMKPFLGTQC